MQIMGKEFLGVGKIYWQENCIIICPWKYVGLKTCSLTCSSRSDLQKNFFSFLF